MSDTKFDEAQLEAINIEKNAVVSAGAGSGKTSVLAARFSHLVLDKKINVDEILTLTFTKKATVEMYGRIYQTLKSKNPEAVADFYKANIKTLDSYCSYISKKGAHFYGISPTFSVDKSAVEDTIRSLALPYILQHRDNPGIKTLSMSHSFERIADELFVQPMLEYSRISQPIDFEKNLEIQLAKIFSDLEKVVQENLVLYYQLRDAYEDYSGNKNTKFLNHLKEQFAKPIPSEDCSFNSTKEFPQLVDFINHFIEFTSAGLSGVKSEGIKNPYNALKTSISKTISLANFIYGEKTIRQLIPLLNDFQNQVNKIKRQNSILTYADVSSLALQILIDHPEIRLSEKKKYKSIMIDEFQDNNEMQKNLLFLLAEKENRNEKSIPAVEDLVEGKLFFVGDEKQSIYRFRGADVSVFRGLSENFKDGNLRLATNYRSDPTLIAAFNTIFGGTPYPLAKENQCKNIPSIFFTQNNDDVKNYEAIYSDAEISEASKKEISAMSEKKISEQYKQKIHFAFYDKKNTDTDENKFLVNDEAQIAWVVDEIKNLMETKNAKPEDFAILFRGYKYQVALEQRLLQEGIPYNTETVTGFFRSSVVVDIFSFLRICAYPKDFLAYEKVLKSSIVNLSTEEINSILTAHKKMDDDDCFAFNLDAENILNGLSLERFNHAKKLYEKISVESKDQSLVKTLDTFWYEAGYRYETFWNHRTTMFASLYDKIFELARQCDSDCKNLADFVDSVLTYEDESKHLDDMDIPLEQKPGVHLMTIHKSKGLQFEYVFIPNVDHGSSKDSNQNICYYSKEFGLSINTPPHPDFGVKTNYFWDLVSEESKNMAKAELKRLIYVAITRAKKEVYITGTIGRNSSDSIYALLKDQINYFYPEYEDGNMKPNDSAPFDYRKIEPIAIKKDVDFGKGKADVISRVDKDYEKSMVIEKTLEQSKYISPSKLYTDEENSGDKKSITSFSEIDQVVESSKGRFSFADFGSIAHLYMESAINGTNPELSSRLLSGLEGNKAYLKTVVTSCEKMREQFVQSDLGKDALNSKWHKAEYSFKSLVADKIVSGQMDLIFENPDGSFTLVDYKTNHEIEPEIYYKQLACYKQALSQMRGVPSNKVRCVLYYLRHGKAVDISEECSKVDLEKAVQEIYM